MFKTLNKEVWAFDAEWVPDPLAGKLLYDLPDSLSNHEIIERMWQENGADEENPEPFLKTIMCRLVSISSVVREEDRGKTKLHLLSLPRDINNPEELLEKNIVQRFLEQVGKRKPQIVGYNSTASDVLIFVQRAVVHGLYLPDFAKRPAKPWEGLDYFDSRNSEAHIDMKDILSSWGKGTPSLNELTVLSGIPGKIDVDGNQVVHLWLDGKMGEIVAYNEFDALSTYLLWLRLAHFGGFFSSTHYQNEICLLRDMVMELSESKERQHLKKYLTEWDELSEKIKSYTCNK